MAIVSSDGNRRIGPKVFADVPSAVELASVRRSRGQMFVLAILLLGLLIATAFGAYLLWGQVASAAPERQALTQQVTDLTAERDALRLQLAEEYDEYSVINERRARVAELRSQIAAVIDQHSAAANNLPRNSAYLSLRDTNGSWGASKLQAENALTEEINSLTAELAAVRRYRPPTSRPTTSTPATAATPN